MIYRTIFNLKGHTFTISTLCKIFSVDRSGYYKWISKGMPTDYVYDEYLSKFIKEIRSEGKEYLGIRRHGVKYSEYKINRHLKLCGLETRTEKRDYSGFNIDNLLIDKETKLKNYEPTGINKLWVADASSILVKSGHVEKN